MPFLRTGKKLAHSEIFSVFYHNLFDYPMAFSDIVRWNPKNAPDVNVSVDYKNGFYFIKGREGLIYKRTLRKRISDKKIKIARKASRVISFVPTIEMVCLSGSLAMNNATEEGDIDLLIVTKKGRLWSSRIMVYFILKFFGFSLRKPEIKSKNNKLCLNLWLDESDLVWSKQERNFYTAHEILQTIPLFDRGINYEKFLSANKWAFDYWPNGNDIKLASYSTKYFKLKNLNLVETFVYKIQLFYMKSKITNEIITPTRAVFHPHNLSLEISKKIPLTSIL